MESRMVRLISAAHIVDISFANVVEEVKSDRENLEDFGRLRNQSH